MRKHNQIHTLGALHYKAHFRFLSKLKDFKCALWSKTFGKCVSAINRMPFNYFHVMHRRGHLCIRVFLIIAMYA